MLEFAFKAIEMVRCYRADLKMFGVAHIVLV